MHRLLLNALASLLLLPGALARAAEPANAPVPIPAPAAVELARLLMPPESWNRMTQGLNGQMVQFAESFARQEGGTCPDGLVAGILDDVTGAISYMEVLDIAASVYAKHYTEAELKELLAFYRTPLGTKTVRLLPELAQDSSGQVMALMQQRLPALMEQTKARVTAYFAEHPSVKAGPSAKEAPAEK